MDMDTLNRSFEPMDIDMSSSVTENMDISSDYDFAAKKSESTTLAYDKLPEFEVIEKRTSSIKKYQIKINRDLKKSANKNIKLIGIVFVLALSLIIVPIFNVICADELNIDQLKTALNSKVYGQTKAIESVVHALSIKERKLLIFYGGTGVGKTYTASLIMEVFGQSSNLYHYTMPSFDKQFSIDFLLGFTICKSSFFIIDDLKKDDILVKMNVIDIINKSKSLGKNVTIILIYNCMNAIKGFNVECDNLFHEQLEKHFEDVDAIMKIIKFQQLTEEHLKKCIENEIGHEVIRTLGFSNVYKNFNVAIDGCKGVQARMRLYKP